MYIGLSTCNTSIVWVSTEAKRCPSDSSRITHSVKETLLPQHFFWETFIQLQGSLGVTGTMECTLWRQ